MKKTLSGALVALVIGGALALVPAIAASAHVPQINATCDDGLVLHATAYDGNVENVWSYTLGTDATVSGTFGSSFDKTVPLPQAGATTHVVAHIAAADGGYAQDFDQQVGPCGEVPPPVDVCSNIDGNQATIPDGLISDGDGGCITPPVDVCANLDGVQTTVPEGLVQAGADCVTPPPPFDRPVCTGNTTLAKVNAANPGGWGDLKNATFTAAGVQLTATATEEAYAYVDFAAVKLTEMGNLLPDTANPDQVGVILQQSNGDSIHYDSDGRYWTVHPGLFPQTSPGMYSTYDITGPDLLSNPDVVEYALWSNPGQSALVTAAHFNCQTQPFGEDAVIVTPPPAITQLPSTPALAETGVTTGWLAPTGLAALLIGVGAVTIPTIRRRIARR